MITKNELEIQLRKLKPILVKTFSVERIGYFGSYVSDTQNIQSDPDIFVEFSVPIGWNFLHWNGF